MSNIVELAINEVGTQEYSLRHREYLLRYSQQDKIARSYLPTMSDHWCALFISYLLLEDNQNTDCTEVSVAYMKELYSNKNLIAKDPQIGYTIFYSLGGTRLDHVGIIADIDGEELTVIEGNYSDSVGVRIIQSNDSRIKYYGKNYVKTPEKENEQNLKTNTEIANEVIQGLWGNGVERITNLTDYGYNYEEIQSLVNDMIKLDYGVKKTNEQIVEEVIQGLWGNGEERKLSLEQQGYDYNTIQLLVNEVLK